MALVWAKVQVWAKAMVEETVLEEEETASAMAKGLVAPSEEA